ncbi:MAG TPA: CU044_2847 family protein [Chloroflexia bacterium]|jgi:hypothetical protein
MPYGKLLLENGVEVLVEVEDTHIGQISEHGVITGLQASVTSILDVIRDTAESVHSGLQKVSASARPSSVELTFSIKISAEAGIVIARAGTEGTFEITLKWGS